MKFLVQENLNAKKIVGKSIYYKVLPYLLFATPDNEASYFIKYITYMKIRELSFDSRTSSKPDK